jgi:hypothetical protein
MWNEIAVELLDENTNKSTKFCFKKRTKWKYKQKHQILVECLAGLCFGERIWCWHCHIEKYVSNFVMLIITSNHAMLLVQIGINSTRDALVLLIPNCTRHRMITYTKVTLLSETLGGGGQLLSYCVGYLSRCSVPRAFFKNLPVGAGGGIYKKGPYYTECREMTDGCWWQKRTVCNSREAWGENNFCIFYP